MQRTPSVVGLWWLVLLTAAGCSNRPSATPLRVAVGVARVERRSMPVEIAATGTVEPIRTVRVTSQVNGMLRGVRFAEGQEVTAGQVLFQIDSRPFRAALQQTEANLSRDAAQAENAAREAERYRTLASGAIVTEEDYQQKQASATALAATVRADSAALTLARLNVEYATIRAPIAGRTGALLVHEGNLVRANESTPLVTINQIRPILVRFAVPAAQLPELQRRRRQALQVLARTGRDAAPPLEGVLSFMDNRVDSTTGTVLLKAHFPNRDGLLWPGEFVEVRLVLDVQPDAMVVPAQAVLTGQRGTSVFAITADGTAEERPVTVARTVDTLAVIAVGVTPGMLVVTDGQLRLTPNARVEIRSGPTVETKKANP
ncbi:MAG: efflux RND transporter periplasmic adaptor subunit [Gemmatimonadales bacterium]